jgi:hypothetical protein
MTRSIICAIVLASAAAGCSGSGAKDSPETLAKSQQALIVENICKGFDGYTGALAEATIDCLGSIRASDYKVVIDPKDNAIDGNGFLVPAFGKDCPAEPVPPPRQVGGKAQAPQVSAFARIQSILSVQRAQPPTKLPRPDGTFVPLELFCIRDSYVNAAANLGDTPGPNWHKQFAGGVPTTKRMKFLASRYPKPVQNREGSWVVNLPPPGSPPPLGFRFPKEYFFYTVSWDNTPPQTACGNGDPVRCATDMAIRLFHGFFVGRFGKYLVGDPYLWLDPTNYDDWDASDPYRVNGYYHPMSLSGGSAIQIPGPIYGDFARGKFDDVYNSGTGSSTPLQTNDSFGNPLGYTTPAPDNQAELCTRWDGSDHRVGRLVQDKLLPDPSTWLSVCEFWPADPSFGDPFSYTAWPP